MSPLTDGHDGPPEVHQYEIRVQGRLDPHWSDWLGGLTMTYADGDVRDTILCGPVVDQAALHGLLIKIRDLGVPLLAVQRLDPAPGRGCAPARRPGAPPHPPQQTAREAQGPETQRTPDATEKEDTTMSTTSTAAFPYAKQRAAVLGQSMAYVEVGEGDPIVFLHGNPTSSYLWRNVLPHLAGLGRCIAPDLIGMGDSAKLPHSGSGSYTFVEHRRYLDALLEALGVRERVTLVVHDWGSALGFDWANRHRDAVRGIAYMEAIVRPRSWDLFPPAARPLFQALRSEAGEAMILERNAFVEQVLPGGILRALTEEEMAEYRRPFAQPGEGRRPTLTWPRQIPIDGEPADVTAIVSAYGEWLATSRVPKLFVKGEPGAALSDDALVDFCRNWPAQTEVQVRGIHFLQEDAPDEIGRASATWLTQIGDTQPQTGVVA